MKIVDAHQHFWNVDANYLPWLADKPVNFRYGDYSSIKRNYLPDEYLENSKKFDVVGSVFIETEWDPTDPLGEVAWVKKIRAETGLPSVMVAQAWLDADDAGEILGSLGQTSFVRGIRHKPTASSSAGKIELGAPGSMADPNWRRGYAQLAPNGLSFDLQTPWWHLPEAYSLAQDYPETHINLNHTGLPSDRSTEGLKKWSAAMKLFARASNTAVKISGIGLPNQPWSAEDNKRIVLETIEIFGVDRCMFASNFPVDSLVGTFETIFDGFDEITSGFDADERDRLFNSNAGKFYRIEDNQLLKGSENVTS